MLCTSLLLPCAVLPLPCAALFVPPLLLPPLKALTRILLPPCGLLLLLPRVPLLLAPLSPCEPLLLLLLGGPVSEASSLKRSAIGSLNTPPSLPLWMSRAGPDTFGGGDMKVCLAALTAPSDYCPPSPNPYAHLPSPTPTEACIVLPPSSTHPHSHPPKHMPPPPTSVLVVRMPLMPCIRQGSLSPLPPPRYTDTPTPSP